MNIKKFVSEFELKALLFEPTKRYLVYVISYKRQVVYIGKSDVSGFQNRLNSHKNRFKYDEVQFIETGSSLEVTLQVESGLISAVKPKYNDKHKDFSYDKIIKMGNRLDELKNRQPDVIEKIIVDDTLMSFGNFWSSFLAVVSLLALCPALICLVISEIPYLYGDSYLHAFLVFVMALGGMRSSFLYLVANGLIPFTGLWWDVYYSKSSTN